jgi:hypothetical protein
LIPARAPDRGTEEVQLRRLDAAGALTPAHRGLWESGRASEAVKGTEPNRHSRRKGDPVPFGPHVPAPLPLDTIQASDALGRAWLAGLISEEERDIGRRFAILYWRQLPQPSPVAAIYRALVPDAIDDMQAGSAGHETPEEIKERDLRLDRLLLSLIRGLDSFGHDYRRVFDQLVLDMNMDDGPAWLDRLIVAKRAALAWNVEHRRRGFDASDAEWWKAPVAFRPADLNAWQHARTLLEHLLTEWRKPSIVSK